MSQRDIRVDVLRGVCLVLMTLSHLRISSIDRFVVQPIGIVNATECFVFISGLVSAWLMSRLFVRAGEFAVAHRALSRSFQLWVLHVAMVLATISIATDPHRVTRDIPKGIYFWIQTLALQFQPGYTNILPMYVLFIAMTPLLLRGARLGYGMHIVVLSGVIWSVANYLPLFGSPEFNLWSWQLVFVSGVMIGYWRWSRGERVRIHPVAIAASVAAALVFFVIRHAGILHLTVFRGGYFENAVIHRHALVLGRIINFSALTILITAIPRKLDRFITNNALMRGLSFVGEHSLQVFCWSICTSIIAAKYSLGFRPASVQVAAAVVIASSLLIPAWLHKVYRGIRKKGSAASRLATAEA